MSPAATSAGSQAYNELDASKLVITKNTKPSPVPAIEDRKDIYGSKCTDHMITATWRSSTGWEAPELKPYGPLPLMPTSSVLHYATECFEGIKAYRGYDGKLRLLRPSKNAERMLMSCLRVSLPGFPPAEFEKLIYALLAIDGPRWLPASESGSFIYLRPTMIGTQQQLGVQTPNEAMLFIIATYLPPMDAPADRHGARLGGEAKARGFNQILWLYGPEQFCTEAGASNFFVVWRTREGKTQLVTAPLDDKLILAGVTRSAVLGLARERMADDLEVVERKYSISEVMEAHVEGRLLEMFASGTAYFICPISSITHDEYNAVVPVGDDGKGGPVTEGVKSLLRGVVFGTEDHPYAVVVAEQE
ncbi:Branched-chain-amino-acid aminotransferase mitochondrial [Ceratocystis platani]|uniref:Branched-chain-amino-acid aminotransferase n=1 Tax=Ceratocystis fimbriata f. sp. platani TaxID=88771 RepID=A0A0F8B2I6_CERFI|nr:Branched-chain-amino-acid aminotransferase mitochondrial [Ceratocystis platani]